MNTPNIQSQGGFSFVETLVAITILLLVIVGPMTVSSTASRSTSFSSEQVIAFFLAQEGLELAQKMRDDWVLKGFDGGSNGWGIFSDDTTTGTYADCYSADGCGLYSDGITVNSTKCDTVDKCRLYYNSDTDARALYTHFATGNTKSPYTRIVTFEKIPGSSDEVKVTSYVYWRSGNLQSAQEISTDISLFNVYDK